MKYEDRYYAGRTLAEHLTKFKSDDSIVLALPRGGVPVAYEVAKSLGVPLDLLLVRKIGAPHQKELAIGAIAEDGTIWRNDKICDSLHVPQGYFDDVVQNEKKNIQYQSEALRSEAPALNYEGKTVIVVDDGIATGSTMLAAVMLLKKRKVKKIVVSAPVCSSEAALLLRQHADEVICDYETDDFQAVGRYYWDFDQVENEEVKRLLRLYQVPASGTSEEVQIPIDLQQSLKAIWSVPRPARAVVIFVHGSGSSRLSPRNQKVALGLNQAGYSTLLFDLLTDEETANRKNVFDIELLSKRLKIATQWVQDHLGEDNLPLFYFGASTGAAAALTVAAQKPYELCGVISRGGRPDLASHAFASVKVPVLLLVGCLDHEVIKLNQQSMEHLEQCELQVIKGAGHVFEEPGTLEQVQERTIEWIGEIIARRELTRANKRITYMQALHQFAEPLTAENMTRLIVNAVKDKKVVMLGEATHGTEEFYELRKKISLELIKNHGFSFVSVEGDWPEATLLNEYIHADSSGNVKQVLSQFSRWPTWMWSNRQIADLAEELHLLNKNSVNVDYYGLDLYSLYASMDAAIGFVKEFYPEIAEKFVEAYSCFAPFKANEIQYTRSLLQNAHGCTDEVAQNLSELLKIRLNYGPARARRLFTAQQNARVVKNAEQYYRAMLEGSEQSWNVRDRHMLETLEILLDHHGANAKAIVWAHNTHIGDYRATDMLKEGYVNIGGLAREQFGAEQVALVGFGTYEGTVTASSKWGGKETIFDLAPAQANSIDHYLHEIAAEKKTDGLVLSWIGKVVPQEMRKITYQRAVGVVYQPKHEGRARDVPTNLALRYDAYIFVNRTHALQSLKRPAQSQQYPDLWPSAL